MSTEAFTAYISSMVSGNVKGKTSHKPTGPRGSDYVSPFGNKVILLDIDMPATNTNSVLPFKSRLQAKKYIGQEAARLDGRVLKIGEVGIGAAALDYRCLDLVNPGTKLGGTDLYLFCNRYIPVNVQSTEELNQRAIQYARDNASSAKPVLIEGSRPKATGPRP